MRRHPPRLPPNKRRTPGRRTSSPSSRAPRQHTGSGSERSCRGTESKRRLAVLHRIWTSCHTETCASLRPRFLRSARLRMASCDVCHPNFWDQIKAIASNCWRYNIETLQEFSLMFMDVSFHDFFMGFRWCFIGFLTNYRPPLPTFSPLRPKAGLLCSTERPWLRKMWETSMEIFWIPSEDIGRFFELQTCPAAAMTGWTLTIALLAFWCFSIRYRCICCTFGMLALGLGKWFTANKYNWIFEISTKIQWLIAVDEFVHVRRADH